MTPVDGIKTADNPRRALVTGASSGIGAATVRRLRTDGWDVVATARRTERLEALAEETDCKYFSADLTKDDEVEALVAFVRGGGVLHSLVNNAGGAIGVDSIEHGRVSDWLTMYERNVLMTLRLTQALLADLRKSGAGDVLVVTSTAALDTYPGGGGYVAAKHAERAIITTLRLELVGEPIRVLEVAPGMVRTEEFSLNRLGGDEAAADAVYSGVDEPLVAEDIADGIAWALSRPHHMNVDLMVLRPRAQATNTLIARD